MDKKDTRWNQKLLRKKRYPSPPLNSVDVTSTLVFNTVFDSLMDVKNFLKIDHEIKINYFNISHNILSSKRNYGILKSKY